MSLYAIYDMDNETRVIAMAGSEEVAERIKMALELLDVLEQKHPGLFRHGEEPVNGADLVGTITEHVHEPSSDRTGEVSEGVAPGEVRPGGKAVQGGV